MPARNTNANPDFPTPQSPFYQAAIPEHRPGFCPNALRGTLPDAISGSGMTQRSRSVAT